MARMIHKPLCQVKLTTVVDSRSWIVYTHLMTQKKRLGTLLEQAKLANPKSRVKLPPDELLDAALAVTKGEITVAQVKRVMYPTTKRVTLKLWTSIQVAVAEGRIRIVRADEHNR